MVCTQAVSLRSPRSSFRSKLRLASGLQGCFVPSLRSPPTPLGVGSQGRCEVVLEASGSHPLIFFHSLSTVSPPYQQVPHPRVQPTWDGKYFKK